MKFCVRLYHVSSSCRFQLACVAPDDNLIIKVFRRDAFIRCGFCGASLGSHFHLLYYYKPLEIVQKCAWPARGPILPSDHASLYRPELRAVVTTVLSKYDYESHLFKFLGWIMKHVAVPDFALVRTLWISAYRIRQSYDSQFRIVLWEQSFSEFKTKLYRSGQQTWINLFRFRSSRTISPLLESGEWTLLRQPKKRQYNLGEPVAKRLRPRKQQVKYS